MGKDPFEEFEFKPLTDGLGFHSKKAKEPVAVQGQQGVASFQSPTTSSTNKPTHKNSKMSANMVNPDLDFIDENPFKSPLPRKNAAATATASTKAQGLSAVDDILANMKKSRHLESEKTKKTQNEFQKTLQGQQETEWSATIPQASALFLDLLLVTATGLLCMIFMLIITKVDLLRNLSQPDTQGMIYLSTLSVFVGVAFIYTLCNRFFLGYTPGEWAYDIRLGKPQETGTGDYLVRSGARQLLILISGGIILPVLSMVLQRDLAGEVTGTTLYKRN